MKIEIVHLILTTDNEEWFDMDVPMPFDIVKKGETAMKKWVVTALTDFVTTHSRDNE